MKKNLCHLLILFFTACGNGATEPSLFDPGPWKSLETITIQPSAVTLEEEKAYPLTAELRFSGDQVVPKVQKQFTNPLNTFKEKILWISSDPAIVEVGETGVIHALQTGTAEVTAWVEGKEEIRGKTGITILPQSVSVSGSASLPNTVPINNCLPPEEPPDETAPFADRLVSYSIGRKGGFHEELLPEIVLGPPHGAGNAPGGFDVFSLGLGGEIILEFTDFVPVDGPGPDFVVFENSFSGFFEPAQVFASADGNDWHPFPCSPTFPDFKGCAGGQPVYANPDRNNISPTDPTVAGGDAYDLADIGLCQARFIRIVDINGCAFYNDPAHCSDSVSSGVLGFDLDAVAVVNGIKK
ncbi:MAG: Ig-like domain-containing protein [Deltaproteobacteria bacterium]|nr:Ig-like domain-containing protein [Deltaproteobacteria bacterium]